MFVFIWISILVSFTDPNKQFFSVKYVFKFLNHGVSVQEIYRFLTFLGMPIKFMSGNT